MYCSKCGKELFDEAIMCPLCGTPTENSAQETASPTPTPHLKPDIKAYIVNGEIKKLISKEVMEHLLFADFYLYDDRIEVEIFSTTGRIKQGVYTLKNGYFSVKKKQCRMLFYKFNILTVKSVDFSFSLFTVVGNLAKIIENAPAELYPEYTVTNSKLSEIEQMLKERLGG